jgi:hypothetical protein
MLSRRQLLAQSGGGLGLLALADLTSGAVGPGRAPRAKRVVQLFMSGAASQVDTFDYKPLLLEKNGAPFDPGGEVELFQSSPGAVMQSPWRWRRHGQCGKWVSDLVPHLGACADDIAFLHGMVSTSNVHGPATFLQTTGFARPGFPSMGAWISYGLGSVTDELPTFVVLPDARGYAPGGPRNWSAGFLPTQHQASMIRPDRAQPIHDLHPHADGGFVTPASERDGRATLARLNRAHLRGREDDPRLEARIASYEMAAQLQLSAPEALDVSTETQEVRDLYGVERAPTADFGRRCLVARRLLERGVRFVQIWSGADNGHPRRNWDSHEDIEKDHGVMAAEMDRPAAALLVDLKRRGMLDDTIVLWTTEFGRMPCSQGSKGRDHNPFGFTNWLAGGGVKGGVSYGATDEWSFRAVDAPTTGYDVHATMLHLLGIDHEQLTFRHNGIDRRLTDVAGRVITEILR